MKRRRFRGLGEEAGHLYHDPAVESLAALARIRGIRGELQSLASGDEPSSCGWAEATLGSHIRGAGAALAQLAEVDLLYRAPSIAAGKHKVSDRAKHGLRLAKEVDGLRQDLAAANDAVGKCYVKLTGGAFKPRPLPPSLVAGSQEPALPGSSKLVRKSPRLEYELTPAQEQRLAPEREQERKRALERERERQAVRDLRARPPAKPKPVRKSPLLEY